MTTEVVDADEVEVNTSRRWSRYCREEHADGRKCSLYFPHEGKHKPKHGTEADRW